MTKKSIFETLSFIWIFIVMCIFGIYLFSFGFKELNIKPQSMIQESGRIDKMEYEKPFLYIKLNSYSKEFKTSDKDNISLIRKTLNVGDTVKIYIKEKDFHFIQRITRKEQVIVDTGKQVFINVVIIIIGFSVFFFSFYYLGRKLKQNYDNKLFIKKTNKPS